MIDLNEGIDFEEYLNLSKEEYKREQLQIYNQINLSEKSKEIINKINKNIDIVIFAEIYCPDCRILMPYLEKIKNLNANINLYIFPRTGYEKIMEEYIGVTRIPTILRVDSAKQPLGQFVEFPEDFKKELEGMEQAKKKDLIKEYRNGEYNKLIEQEIIKDIILS